VGPIQPAALWADSYAPAAGVRTLSLGGRRLVYAEDQQQVLELNETADRIWRSLAVAGSVAAAAKALGALGLSPEQALELVRDAASRWTVDGYLAPQALSELLERRLGADRTLVLDELVVEFRLCGVGCEELDAVFGHLYGTREGPRRRLTIIEQGGQLLFYLERHLVIAGGRDGMVAQVKAIVTDLYIDAIDNGFFAHGALLLDGERRLLLSGEPGAGKTTLALALTAAGWRYGGDDIVRISPDGAVQGVPFAAAVKDGSVSLLGEIWPDLGRFTAWARSDGQQVRYLLPTNRATAPSRALSVVVTLARRPGAVAETMPISAFDALSAIVQSAYARRWRMTGDAFCALAESLDQAVCVRLEYSDLGPAVQAIEDVARVQA
jgi:hypothetical protein